MIVLDFNGKKGVFFGDSITFGAYVTSDTRWTKLICNAKNGVEDNRGVSGATLETNIQDYNCGRSYFNIADIPVKGSDHSRLFIAYNTNDILVNKPNMNASNFKEQLSLAVENALLMAITSQI
jgi:lysophospholipase L1-like esterase